MNFVAAAVSSVAAVLITPLLLHHLGEASYGVWVLAVGLAGYLQLLELGFSSASTKLMADDAGRRPADVSATLSTTFVILVITGLVCLGIGLLMALAAPHLIKIAPGLGSETTSVIAILAIGVAASIPGDVFGGALAAYQRYDLRSVSNMILVVLSTVATFALVLSGRGLVAIAVATSAISVLLHPVRWAFLRRVDPDVHLRASLVTRARLAAVSRVSGWFLLADVSGVVSYSADLVIIGAVLGVKGVALYAIGSKVSVLATRALNETSTVLLPEAAALTKDGTKANLAELLVDGTRVTMLVGLPISLITAMLARSAVRAWVGHGYDGAAIVLVLLSVNNALGTVVNPVESVVIGAGKIREWAISMSLQAAVNLALTITFVLTVGLSGPAIGTLAGTTLVIGPAFIVFACTSADLRVLTFLRRILVPHILPSALLAAGLFLARGVAARGRLPLIVVGAAGMVVYLLSYYFLSATADERRHLHRIIARFTPGASGPAG